MSKSLSVKNIHGTFTAASEAAIDLILASATRGKESLVRRVLDVYDGTEWMGKRSHFARYSERTLAIMLCDCYHEDVARDLAYQEERNAEIAAANGELAAVARGSDDRARVEAVEAVLEKHACRADIAREIVDALNVIDAMAYLNDNEAA